jgi:AcrR family transcriptional regulator
MESTGTVPERRGRPPLHSDDEILEAALLAFSLTGFEAMSLRALNRDLGLSHGTVNMRFSSKDDLFRSTVDRAFGRFLDDMEEERARSDTGDDLTNLRSIMLAFIRASSRHPHLMRLMDLEGQVTSSRLDYVFGRFIEPSMRQTMSLIRRLQMAGQVRPVTSRALFFLLAHGAIAPFTLAGLSTHFDHRDGALDNDAHAELVTDMLIAALTLSTWPTPAQPRSTRSRPIPRRSP